MKQGIHPDYHEVVFYTGKQKFVDTAGRVEKFMRKYEQAQKQADKKGKK